MDSERGEQIINDDEDPFDLNSDFDIDLPDLPNVKQPGFFKRPTMPNQVKFANR